MLNNNWEAPSVEYSYKNLPTNQKLLFIAHTMTAVAALLATFANIIAMSENSNLMSDIKTPQPESKAKDYFGRYS
jgi:hypothetical protein